LKYKDYYDILGLSRDASEQEIKSAYRKLARKHHPDVNKNDPGASQKFKEINEAYEVLSDPAKRKRYDSLGNSWQQGADFTPPPGYENISFEFGDLGDLGNFASEFTRGGAFGGFSDFFEAIFGDLAKGGFSTGSGFDRNHQSHSSGSYTYDTGTRGRKHKGQSPHTTAENLDIEETIHLTPQEMHTGTEKSVRVAYAAPCDQCSGRGSTCYNCGGSGITTISKNLNVKIPAGVKEGSKIRLSGEGKTSNRRKGDLYLKVRQKYDPRFKIENEHVMSEVEISAPEAVLGCTIEVETLQGNYNLKVPPGTQAGKTLRLKGLGLPKSDGNHGDHKVKLKITIPENPSEEEKNLYKKLHELGKKK
jgi:curved DNA-binding protein